MEGQSCVYMYIYKEVNTYKKREGRNLQSYSLINITQRNVMHSVQWSGVPRVGCQILPHTKFTCNKKIFTQPVYEWDIQIMSCQLNMTDVMGCNGVDTKII